MDQHKAARQRTQLGARIRRRRRDLDLTQADLANLSGIPQFHISAIETGRVADVLSFTLWRLAQALGVSTDSLLAQDGTGTHTAPREVPEEAHR
jgi:transcriptional regulator with XRE-family HTH domain